MSGVVTGVVRRGRTCSSDGAGRRRGPAPLVAVVVVVASRLREQAVQRRVVASDHDDHVAAQLRRAELTVVFAASTTFDGAEIEADREPLRRLAGRVTNLRLRVVRLGRVAEPPLRKPCRERRLDACRARPFTPEPSTTTTLIFEGDTRLGSVTGGSRGPSAGRDRLRLRVLRRRVGCPYDRHGSVVISTVAGLKPAERAHQRLQVVVAERLVGA